MISALNQFFNRADWVGDVQLCVIGIATKMNPVFSDDISQFQPIETKNHRSKNGALRNPTFYPSVS